MQPTGTITFLFTDIEASTKLWELDPQRMSSALARHDAILRQAIDTNSGFIVKMTGDGVHAAFTTAGDALLATIAAQLALVDESWSLIQPISVRMALHTGQAEWREDDYYGPAVNRAARIMSIASGGQILLSTVTAELVRDLLPEGVGLLNLGQHRLRSLDRPERIYQLIHPKLPADFPPIKTSIATPNNLPTQLTSFIGRDEELEEIRSLLVGNGEKTNGMPDLRLLTLTGPGGTGKTRLSLQVANGILDQFADGIWLVELAHLAEPGLVVQAVASTLGLQEQPGQPLTQMLAHYLRRKDTLIILDNCEHVIDACANLASKLLQSCPTLTILASSREALGINGERAYRVRSLPLPSKGEVQSIQALSQYAATHLFLDRAKTVKPDFTLTPENGPIVVQICRRLDGIPLAIELAAARVRILSPQQIAARLDDRFRLLTGGSRTALPRQRTLQALIDWSYDLLSEPECILLRRLSVFSGGWTLEAAEEVAGIEPVQSYEVLDLLDHLINKSIIVTEESDWGVRYRMLETIRQYAQEKLADEDEAIRVRERHLAYFVKQMRLAEEAMIELNTEVYESLVSEGDNIRAARSFALEHDLVSAFQMASMGSFQIFLVLPRAESLRYIESILEKVRERQDFSGPDAPVENRRLLGSALASAAITSFGLGMNPSTIDYATRASQVLDSSEDLQIVASAKGVAAIATFFMGDLEEAIRLQQEAKELAQKSGNRWMLAMATLPLRVSLESDPIAAWENWEEAMALFRESHYLSGMGMAHQVAALMLMHVEEYEEARNHAMQALDLYNELGDMHMSNIPRSILAEAARKTGEFDEATNLYHQAIQVWRDKGNFGGLARCLECLAFIESEKMRLVGAIDTNRVADAIVLIGAAAAIRELYRSPMIAIEQIEYQSEIDWFQQVVDDPTYEAAIHQGQRMNMDQAIIFALGEDGETQAFWSHEPGLTG